MKFSTKSRYALRLMAELARYAPGTTVSLKEISERQNLSLKYLEQIVTPLARMGLVKSERGSQGGYRLTKTPADYTAGGDPARHRGQCSPHPLPGQRDQRVPHVRAVLHPALLVRPGRCHQPVHRQRHPGAAGPEPALRQRGLRRLRHQGLRPHKNPSPGLTNPAKKKVYYCGIPAGVLRSW